MNDGPEDELSDYYGSSQAAVSLAAERPKLFLCYGLLSLFPTVIDAPTAEKNQASDCLSAASRKTEYMMTEIQDQI